MSENVKTYSYINHAHWIVGNYKIQDNSVPFSFKRTDTVAISCGHENEIHYIDVVMESGARVTVFETTSIIDLNLAHAELNEIIVYEKWD